MFTGIIEEVGRVRTNAAGDHHSLRIDASIVLAGTRVGDSISVNGCCLTVTQLDGDGFETEVMTETMRITTLGGLAPGASVNLERAVALGDRLGGHLVQGHIDGVGEVLAVEQDPGALLLTIGVPAALARYLVPKGSIAIDGVSLTIVDVLASALTVGIIPHTRAATTLDGLIVGNTVNLEADIIAKHVEQLLRSGVDTPYSEIGAH